MGFSHSDKLRSAFYPPATSCQVAVYIFMRALGASHLCSDKITTEAPKASSRRCEGREKEENRKLIMESGETWLRKLFLHQAGARPEVGGRGGGDATAD